MSAIIHQLKAGQPSKSDSSVELQKLINLISTCLNDELSSLLGSMFDSADDMLFQLAENADSNEDQSDYFDTMRMLRIERKTIVQKFAKSLKEFLKNQNQKDKESKNLDDLELSLVDQEEMEELVAISSMHSKGMNIYGEAVNHLEARIEFLSLKNAGIFSKEALAPKNICESFKASISDIELSTNNKLVLYKLFDQEVILNLGKMYKKLNQLFIDQGILPQIKLNDFSNGPTARSQKPPTQQQNTAAEQAPVHAPETDAMYTDNLTYNTNQPATYSARQQGQSFVQGSTQGQPNNHHHGSNAQASNSNYAEQPNNGQTANQPSTATSRTAENFINGNLTASGPGIPSSFTTKHHPVSASENQFYDRREVMKSLSNLQMNSALQENPNAHFTAADFKRQILSDMGRRTGGAITKQVNQVDEKTIDFIEMLFNAITEDISISEAVTNLLLRLQIPVIKVAMLDNQFFSDSTHPCRITLNLIAHLGRGLTSNDDSLFTELNSIVETLLSEFDNDIVSFENALDQLEKIELIELDKTAEKERDTQQRVLRMHAREIVLIELQHHLRNNTLPKSAQNLILRNWSTLMFHRYIKFGKSSDEWKQSVNTVVSLIKLLQPIESSHAYNKLHIEKDELIDTLHSNLLETMQNPVDIETEINSLFLHFEDMLENCAFSPSNIQTNGTYFGSAEEDDEDFDLDASMEPMLEIEEEIEDPFEEKSNLAHEKISLLPSDVRPGVWFKVFNGEDAAARRAKLSVIIMEEAKLVFVDRLGSKVIEKDADIFTEELKSDLSLIIADHSAFDHALGMVINSLSPTT